MIYWYAIEAPPSIDMIAYDLPFNKDLTVEAHGAGPRWKACLSDV